MKKIFISFIVFLIWIGQVYSQNLNEFKSILDDCGMNLDIPAKFIETEINENDRMEYQYAITNQDKKLEVRYSIRPIRYKKYENEEVKDEVERQIPLRNSKYYEIFQSVASDLAVDVDYTINELDQNTVKEEFDADWGATAFVKLNTEFGIGYTYCLVVAIHKKDIADAYMFYLSDTKDQIMENAKPLFNILKFD